MTEEFNWDNAVQEWQEHQPDLPAIKKNMRWLSIRMKAILALDVISLLIFIPFTFYILLNENSLSFKLWMCFGGVFAAIGVYFDFYLRRDLWQQPNTTLELLSFLHQRAKTGVQLAKFSMIYMAIFLVALCGWLGFNAFDDPAKFESHSLWAPGISFVIIISTIVVSFVYYKRKLKEVEQTKMNLREFTVD